MTVGAIIRGEVLANEENLIPLDKRTKDEQREIASKGGKASGKSRRKRKLLKDSMNALLDLSVGNKKEYNALVKMGVPVEDINNSQLIVVALFNQAKKGDVAAIKELRNLIGEDGKENEGTGQIERLIEGLKHE